MLSLKAQTNPWVSHDTGIVLNVKDTIEALTMIADGMTSELGQWFGIKIRKGLRLTAADVMAHTEKEIVQRYGTNPHPDAADEIEGERDWARMLINEYKLK